MDMTQFVIKDGYTLSYEQLSDAAKLTAVNESKRVANLYFKVYYYGILYMIKNHAHHVLNYKPFFTFAKNAIAHKKRMASMDVVSYPKTYFISCLFNAEGYSDMPNDYTTLSGILYCYDSHAEYCNPCVDLDAMHQFILGKIS